MKVLIVLPHSHTWLTTQSAVTTLKRFQHGLEGQAEVEIIVVDNSEWSPSIRGITDTALGEGVRVVENGKMSKYHATALDYIIETETFDYLLASETDVFALKDGWLKWFMDQLKPSDFAAGARHHEEFLNPSCTLYRAEPLLKMLEWCRSNDSPIIHWGPEWQFVDTLPDGLWKSNGPFAEKRGWPANTVLATQPTGQLRGPGWFEPGQQLYHQCMEMGYTCSFVPTFTTVHEERHIPTGTWYGATKAEEMQDAYTVHVWGSTRALDLLKHPVSDETVLSNMGYWLSREARYWRAIVDPAVQAETLALIRKYGWKTPPLTPRDIEAVSVIQAAYAEGGVVI